MESTKEFPLKSKNITIKSKSEICSKQVQILNVSNIVDKNIVDKNIVDKNIVAKNIVDILGQV